MSNALILVLQVAPKNMHDAVRSFYKYENFDLQAYRNEVAQDIQILADPNSPRGDTSLIIFDNGEGQHPQEFPNTFLLTFTREQE